MREIRLLGPELVLIGATRGILGIGLGLLLAGKLRRDRRIAVGCTLATIGLLSTIPLGIRVFRRRRGLGPDGRSGPQSREPVIMPS